ncbi:hypothetical protein C8R43DRAFT_963417 [Mycena crocata]|nr:hypothetical protein C8R43DRAFT_963417 [Mycena crocata]
MDSPRSTPPFSLRESGDLVSAALDPPFSSVSSQSSSTSSPSAFSSLPFSSPFCTYPTSTSVSDSHTRTNRMERERSRGSLHTRLTRFKRRASAFVGNGCLPLPLHRFLFLFRFTFRYSPSSTASSGSNSKWAAVPSTNSRTLPTSPCPYHIQDLRRSAHVAPRELEFVPFLPPVVQYERERVTASSPNYVGTSAYASSSPSFGAEYIYVHAHAASGLSFHSPHTASASSCTPSPTSSTSSCSPSSSPSASSCSTSTSSEFPPTPTSQIIPPVFEEVKPRRSSVTSDEEGESGDGEHPFLIGEPEKPPRSPPCVLSTRYRLPSPAAASLFAQPNPHPDEI